MFNVGAVTDSDGFAEANSRWMPDQVRHDDKKGIQLLRLCHSGSVLSRNPVTLLYDASRERNGAGFGVKPGMTNDKTERMNDYGDFLDFKNIL
jgi:hypothetical protein